MVESITSLRLKIDSTDVTKAQKELDSLTSASGRAEKGANATASSFSMLGKVLTAGAVIGVTAQYIKLADTMTGMTSKLKLVTNSTSELASAQEELFKIAQKTRQGYAETVDTYSNFAIAMGEMGKSQKDVLRTVETINKAIAISGGTTQQAAAATMQLGQAFASGTLRGDELNSILENSKGLAKAIADGMGVPIGKLRSLGSEGKITAEILANALEKSAASVDEKFGKVAPTVESSMTMVTNSIIKMVGEVDTEINGSGGFASIMQDMSNSMDKHSGKVAYLAGNMGNEVSTRFNAMGASIGFVSASVLFSATSLIEKTVNGWYNAFNWAIYGINRLKGMSEEQATKGTLKLLDVGSEGYKQMMSGYVKEMDAIANKYENYKPNANRLADSSSDKGSGKKGGAGAELTKEQKDALKKAQKLAEEEAKIQRGYLESYAEIQANAALEEYNVKLGYEEAYRDFAAQEAIAQYEMELTMLNDLADRQAQSAIAFYEMTRTEKDKINEENLALYEANAGLFNDEQMQTFFTKWQESIEGVKGGYNEIEGIVSSFVEESLNSKDWTAGLTGTNKALANVGNAYKDIQKQTVKYDKAVKKVNKSNLTDEEKKIELKKIEEAQLGAQIGAYANLAGAMSGFFEEGSKGAKAMTAVSATLGIAQGIQAMISAWGSAPFPFNMPAVAATTAAVLPMIGQLTGMGGSGGGGGATAPAENFEQNKTNIENNYNPMTDRLDRQIELLESIDKNGSASQLGVSLAATSFQRDYALWVEDTLAAISVPFVRWGTETSALLALEQRAGVDAFSVAYGRHFGIEDANILPNMGVLREGLNLIDTLRAAIELQYNIMSPYTGEDRRFYDVSGLTKMEASLNDAQNLIQEWAIGVVSSIEDLKEASEDFKDMFDDITGSMFYESARLAAAYEDVNRLKGEGSFADYLKNTITDITALEKFFNNETFTLLMSDSFSDIEAQIQAINELSAITGETFEGGAREALNYIESIQLVAENMVRVREDTKAVFDDIQSFIDDLTDKSIKNPSVTFGVFSESFNAMIDAISSGSEDMIDISGKAMDNARSYIDVVTATATSSRDIDFAKAIMANKFSGVIATPDLTLNNINNTLNNNNAQLVAELQALKITLTDIKALSLTQAATQVKTLDTNRALLAITSEGVA